MRTAKCPLQASSAHTHTETRTPTQSQSVPTCPSFFVMMRSQLYLELRTHMSVMRSESVANTLARFSDARRLQQGDG